jgi:AraC family transcriptional regulator
MNTTLQLNRHQSFGHCIRQLTLGDTVIRQTALSAATSLPRHQHKAAYVCIVLSGNYIERDQREFDCATGSIVTHPAGDTHSNGVGKHGAQCINVELGQAWLDDGALRQLSARKIHHPMVASHPALSRLGAALRAPDNTAALSAAAATLDLLAAVIGAPHSADPGQRLKRVIDMLEADLSTAPSLDTLAQAAGLHPGHLMRSFKRLHGETIGDYLRRRRLEAAHAALQQGDQAIADIAAAAGFYDQAHFTRAYRRHFGITPGQRRKRALLS